MDIRLDDPRSPPARRLLGQHLDEMALHSPPESRHALDADGLCDPSITFWTAWRDGALLGCGALKELGPRHGEIKSMRTAPEHRRNGVATAMLAFIVAEAKRRGYGRLSLETGSMAAFRPAHELYARHGFGFCEPFGDYRPDPNSVFMTREL